MYLIFWPDTTKVIFEINQAFVDKDLMQTDTLIQLHQVRSFGIITNDYGKKYFAPSGKQSQQFIVVNSKSYSMHIDG